MPAPKRRRGEYLTVGRRVHTVRHGQGRTAWTERVETEVVGITGLTTYDQHGAPAHERHANQRDFQANLINAVVVRKWQGKDYGPGGKTVFLTNAPVEQPLQPFDDYDDRSLIENCCIKEAKQQWNLGHPPQKTQRAVRVHVMFTLLLFALATAYRLQCGCEATAGSPSAGNAGGASSWSGRANRSSCLRRATMGSFISPNIRCWWASSSKINRRALAPGRTSSRNRGSLPDLEAYVGISGNFGSCVATVLDVV
jgi:hypothetical protein